MDKAYDHSRELEIYRQWEAAKVFVPEVPKDIDRAKKERPPFCVILPPPNANDPLHAGHALYVVEDVMCRYHRLLGDPTLWLPGTDHAGIETQFVFEKRLQKEGKSRFDYDRETLFGMIEDYVDKNRNIAADQLRRLGFSLDWTRLRYAMDEDHNQRVYAVFRRMCQEGLIYRDEKIVNFCTFCGTSFSNLEVTHKEVASHLWYLQYPEIMVATTRPETMLGDTAVAVNPRDERYKHLIGKTIKLPLVEREIPVIGEETVDMDFGTGAVKVTPGHSPEDFEMATKHNLEIKRIMDYDGKFNENVPEKYRGLYANQVREMVIADMDELGLLAKVVDYSHEVGHCYRCGHPIEPLTSPQWFVKIQPLAEKAIEAVKDDRVQIFPKRFKRDYLMWMKNIKDWNISRQIVWGQRIPAWYSLKENPEIMISFLNKEKDLVSGRWKNLKDKYSFEEITAGLQTLLAPATAKYYLSREEAGEEALQETDTFDTWFSSGQWPYSTLGWEPDGNHSNDFRYFYPTTVLDTMWDILFFWVARMIMMGIYTTGEVPFRVAHMHARVVDGKGQKMSKSKANVINPMDIVDKYGADALRMALMIGVSPGSDIALSDDKVRAARNFVNKIWNAARFVKMKIEAYKAINPTLNLKLGTVDNTDDKEIMAKLAEISQKTTRYIEKYDFGQATIGLYDFFWHDFCDQYIEQTKSRAEDVAPVLIHVLQQSLVLLHPFVPFVTESIYQILREEFGWEKRWLTIEQWPD